MSATARHRRIFLLVLLALAPGTLAAQDQEPQQAQAPAQAAAPEDEAGDAFARMDSDRDGALSLEEFEAGITRPFGSQREGVVYQKLPARFRVLDADADGYLGAGEYAGLAQRWQGPGAPPPLPEADRNRDGRIDFREFAYLHVPRDEASAEARAATPTAAATR